MDTNRKFSKKHHYLPIFYLKGFSNVSQQTFIYDKVKDEIFKNQDLKSKFYENHLNNYRFGGEVLFTFEETLFTPSDTEISLIFSKLRDTTVHDFTALEKIKILYFINQLYWRLPETTEKFVELICKEGFNNKHFGFVNGDGTKLTDQEVPEIVGKIAADSELKKNFKHLIPISVAKSGELIKLFDKWKVYTLSTVEHSFITGDNPFLINNANVSLDNIYDEMIFPLSKTKALILSDKSPNFIDAGFLSNINVAILNQSKRFIAADNVFQLESVINDLKQLEKLTLVEKIHPGTFGLMHFQSQFKDHLDYLQRSKTNE